MKIAILLEPHKSERAGADKAHFGIKGRFAGIEKRICAAYKRDTVQRSQRAWAATNGGRSLHLQHQPRLFCTEGLVGLYRIGDILSIGGKCRRKTPAHTPGKPYRRFTF